MAKVFKRRCTGFIAGILALCCMLMVVVAIVSNYWVMADLEREVKTKNTTTQLIKGGSKYFGLFSGYSEENFGLGARKRKFTGGNSFVYIVQNKFSRAEELETLN